MLTTIKIKQSKLNFAITNDIVIFEYTCENNTIKKTVEEAVKQGVSLACADLHNADLSGANLAGVNLETANLQGTDLSGANLKSANLQGTDLSGANLQGTDLNGADLAYTHIQYTKFENTILTNAILFGAFLSCVNIKNTNLSSADLTYANFSFCEINNTIIDFPMACPETGSFIGWKKVFDVIKTGKTYLVKLEIPENAKRSSATTDKCRCEFAKVLEIWDLQDNVNVPEVTNYNIKETVYKVGEMVYPDKWDDNRWNECSNGIHFFMDQQRAINYK